MFKKKNIRKRYHGSVGGQAFGVRKKADDRTVKKSRDTSFNGVKQTLLDMEIPLQSLTRYDPRLMHPLYPRNLRFSQGVRSKFPTPNETFHPETNIRISQNCSFYARKPEGNSEKGQEPSVSDFVPPGHENNQKLDSILNMNFTRVKNVSRKKRAPILPDRALQNSLIHQDHELIMDHLKENFSSCEEIRVGPNNEEFEHGYLASGFVSGLDQEEAAIFKRRDNNWADSGLKNLLIEKLTAKSNTMKSLCQKNNDERSKIVPRQGSLPIIRQRSRPDAESQTSLTKKNRWLSANVSPDNSPNITTIHTRCAAPPNPIISIESTPPHSDPDISLPLQPPPNLSNAPPSKKTFNRGDSVFSARKKNYQPRPQYPDQPAQIQPKDPQNTVKGKFLHRHNR